MLVVAGLLTPALAQPVTEEQRLQALERELKAGEAERARLAERQAATAKELESVRATMIGFAATIQEQEYALGVLEARVTELETQEAQLKATLGVRDEQMNRTLMALQRVALRPGDAVTLSPLKPDDAVRTAILLRAALPAVQGSARALETELGALFKVRAEVEDQRQKVALAAAGLLDKRRALERKEEDKVKLQAELAGASEAAKTRLEKLAAEASDLKDLVAKITAERQVREKQREEERKAAEAKLMADIKRQAQSAPPPGERIVLKPPPGVEPLPPPEPTPKPPTQLAGLPPTKPGDLRPFSKARGTMPMPVVGALKRKYGEETGDSALNKGIVLASRAGGQVIAPFDGVVAFAGPFRGYGQLLIIEHSEGYHTLLAGLGRIDCVLDQRVFAGEPVGVMDTKGAPTDLYVELRQNGQPVNPLPFLANRTGNKSSG